MCDNNIEFFTWIWCWIPLPKSLGCLFHNRRNSNCLDRFGCPLIGEMEPTKTEQIIGIGGLFLISITTMIEAKFTHKEAIVAIEKYIRKALKINKEVF